jgi:hypothetical protein
MAASAIFAIQLFEYVDQSVYAGAWHPLNAFTYLRTPRSRWQSLLFGLVCAVLSFAVFAWGTTYKISLLRNANNSSPVKICTRGSDAAKSSVRHMIGDRKVSGQSIAPQPRVNFSIVHHWREDVVIAEACLAVQPRQWWPILVARPPPIRFLFSQ